MNNQQREKMQSGKGFIAALDQSGGSTPKALKLYGLDEGAYKSEAEMFDLIHAMRSRIIKSKAFNGERILGAILFEMTMNRQIDGMGTAEYLWERKGVVPFLKIDNGLADEVDDVQLLKPIPELADRLASAKKHGVFGTKMRSVINMANPVGIKKNVDQQFEIGKTILAADLMPIIEPEVNIKSPQKAEAEALLKSAILDNLDRLPTGQQVMLKLSIPTVANLYHDLVNHPKILRVVALSGGYSRHDANELLAKNTGVIASFSRALTEGLTAQRSEAEFDAALDIAIEGIYEASIK